MNKIDRVFMSKTFPPVLSVGLMLLGHGIAVHAQPVELYVDTNAPGCPSSGVHDGSSWCNAMCALGEAMDSLDNGNDDSVIRVANGTYFPGPSAFPDPRDAAFTLKTPPEPLSIEGGYARPSGAQLNGVTTFRTMGPGTGRDFGGSI